jgi:putative salt-induced outer membrane protein
MRRIVFFTLFFCSQGFAAAEEEPSIWSTDVELGAVSTSGNTEQSNVKFRVDSARDKGQLLQNFHGDIFRAETDGADTADNLYAFYRAGFKLDDKQSLFGRLAYEEDAFSGFDRQIDLTSGYSRKFVDSEKFRFAVETGVGARRTELETGDKGTEGVVRIAGFFEWSVSENALFKQLLSFEVGEDLTTSRSESSLETAIVGNLAMKLAIKVTHFSDVLPGKENPDPESTVTLVYKF